MRMLYLLSLINEPIFCGYTFNIEDTLLLLVALCKFYNFVIARYASQRRLNIIVCWTNCFHIGIVRAIVKKGKNVSSDDSHLLPSSVREQFKN